MIIAVASDSHGATRQMNALLESLPEGLDAFCFLGDMEKDAEYLGYGLEEKCPHAAFYVVVGNNDPFSQTAASIETEFGGVKTLLTHGHLFSGIRLTRKILAKNAAKLGCRLVLYGHTHTPKDETASGVRLINPGALMDGRWALVTVEKRRVSVEFRTL